MTKVFTKGVDIMKLAVQRAAKSAKFIIIFGILTKILGLTKETLIASKLGSGIETDSYFTALIAATLLADIIGEGLSSSLVPILSKIEAKDGKDKKLSCLNNILHMVIIFSLILTIFIWILSPIILKILVRGISLEKMEKMKKLVGLGLPMGVFIMVRSVFMAFLHSEHEFKTWSLSWVFYYLVYIGYLIYFNRYGIYGLMISGILASFVQLLSIMPSLIDKGYKYKWTLNFEDIYLKELIIMLIPIIVSTSINMINVVVDKSVASTLEPGSKSWLNYSDGIIQFVLGVFITAIVTVLFPVVAGEFNRGNIESLKRIMKKGNHVLLSITVPTMVILITLSYPIVELLFERGKFNSVSTIMTSQCLTYYSLGLVSMMMVLVLTGFYYAIHNPIAPMKFAFIGIGANLILDIILAKYMGAKGLALATSISATLITILFLMDINKDLEIIDISNSINSLIKLTAKAMVMAAVVLVTFNILNRIIMYNSIWDLLQLAISIGIGIITYIKAGNIIENMNKKKQLTS